MKIHEKIRLLCQARKITQAQLREEVGGVSKSTITNWFNGSSKPDIDWVFAFSRALDVSLDWLLDDAADYPPPGRAEASQELVSEPSELDKLVIWEIAKAIGIEEAKRRLVRASC